MKLINEISNKLFSIFYVDDKKFGRQQKDGSYKLVKETITVVTIDDMLQNQKSLLTYQELHVVNNARIKWICIDLDISKKEIDSNLVNPENLKIVKEAADIVCVFLEAKKIPFFLEFSGRRGFHIWIIFDKLTSKENGYKLIEYIHKNVKDKFNPIIIADKFPKTPNVSPNTKGIGFGIKLPLSQNKGNGKLSFFLRKGDTFDYDEKNWLSKPNQEFFKNQLAILNSLQTVSIDQIKPFLDEFDLSRGTESKSENFLNSKKADSSFLPQNTNLDSIIKSLSKCEHIEKILFEYEKGLGGKERSILVGLLIHLKTDEDEKLGYNILMELFSNIQGFDKEKTVKNLENLNYFQPITCKNLERCSACIDCKLFSPIELIDGVNLIDKPAYSIKNVDDKLFKKLKDSLYQYSLKNDEVALYPQLKKLENLDVINIQEIIHDIYKGINPIIFESYKFERNEINKTRDLYNLDPINNIISTYFTFILNTIYYSEISDNSYGYQFSHSLYQNNLFNNWFANWARYTRKIETVLFNEEYKEYFLLKIDIKSFYDKIDSKRLRIKLFEEAPLKIREKLNELSPADNEKYKNIVNYLINLSSKTIGNSETGLPQGPAYARYLAELYLNGLDFLIENFILENEGRGFYNRFVDDVFIFVESEERAQNLFKKIKDWLSINSLELNLEKTKLINVKKYADSGDYHKFKDDAKYDINRVNKNKNVLSEEEIQEALSKLDTLTDDVRFGLKDNLRFFYYQFKDDKRLDFIRKKLSQKLPFSGNGRGTLYMIFYADLISNNPNYFWELVNKIDKIKGLSFTHYLNTILLNEDVIIENLIFIHQLIEQTYLRSNLTKADKLLIASLYIKCSSTIKLNYPLDIMNAALEIPNMKFEIEHWELIKEKLVDISDKNSFLIEIDRIINHHTYTILFLNELSSYSFIRFTEWENNNEADFINNDGILILFYHCLCFLTLFEESKDYNNVKHSWELLLKKSKENGEIGNKNYEFTWINKLENFSFKDFSNGSYTFMLSNFLGADYGKSECENLFLKQYKNVLLMLLFAKDRENDFIDFRDNVSKFIDDKSSLFYNWVIDPNVTLYPTEDEICLKNIALNGLIVLKKSNSIFVKSINKKLLFDKYEYLNINSKANIVQEIEYPIEQDLLDKLLNGESIVDVICQLSNLIKEHKFFKDKYKTNYPVFYNPYYSFGIKPMLPFYSDFENFINYKGNIEINSINSYWENIYWIIKHLCNVKLVHDDNPYNFKIDELEKRFFPISDFFINSVEKKINFITKFAENINGRDNVITIFDYQYYWSWTVYVMADDVIKENSTLINYLKIHFDTYNDKNDYIDILFSINEKTDICDSTLADFFGSIKESIRVFQKEIKLKDFDFIEMIDKYIKELRLKKDNEGSILNLEELKLSDIKISKDRDYTSKNGGVSFVYNLILNGGELDKCFKIYLFNNIEFEQIEIVNLEIKLNKSKIYCTINEKSVFIFIPEDELIKAYERIVKRKQIYLDSQDPLKATNLNDLFPTNPQYKCAKNSFISYANQKLVSNLSVHYSNENENVIHRVSNWLSLFNDQSLAGSNLKKYMDHPSRNLSIDSLYKAIILFLNAHYSMDNEDLIFFKENLIRFNENANYILFPIKDPATDENGLFRLLSAIEIPYRSVVFLEQVVKLCLEDCSSKKLVIVTDISISGNQIEKAIKYYTRNFASEKELMDYNSNKIGDRGKSPREERYFTFSTISESIVFRENFEKIKEIVFLSPIITKEFEKKMLALFKGKKISFVCKKPLLEKSNYLFGKALIHRESIDLFTVLIKDIYLLRSIFKINSKDRALYLNSINNINELDLLFRIRSLPSKHIMLFSLESKKEIKLLDYVKNFKNIPTISNLPATDTQVENNSLFMKIRNWFLKFL